MTEESFTSLSFLKLVNELSVISQTGCKDTHFFLTRKFFCTFYLDILKLFSPLPKAPLKINNLHKQACDAGKTAENLASRARQRRKQGEVAGRDGTGVMKDSGGIGFRFRNIIATFVILCKKNNTYYILWKTRRHNCRRMPTGN